MSQTLDPTQLSNYVAERSNSELLEDLSHLFEVNIVTTAIAATDMGRRYKLPVRSVDNLNKAFKIYRDELFTRYTDSDTLDDAGFTLLGEYYKCVKIIRTLSKYLNKILPELESDFTGNYTKLYEHKSSTSVRQSVLED